MIKKVLITGVSGQDGSYMVDYLLKNTEHIIYGMVRRSAKPDYSNFEHNLNNPRFKMVYGDLSDSHSIDSLVKEILPDYFINLAAQSFVAASWQMPEMTFDIDATGIIRCLEAIRKHVPHCRFYNAGSSEEFGDVIYSPQDEKHPLRPRSIYGAAKAASRYIIKVYRESYDLYAVQGLLFNHESERRGEEFVTRKITKGIARIKHAIDNNLPFEPIELGNLDSKRDWSHAEDFVRGIWMMLNQEKYNGKLEELIKDFNKTGHILLPREINPAWHTILVKNLKEYILSSNETHSIREFIELAFNKANIKGVWWNDIYKQPEREEYLFSYDGILATKKYIPLVKINPKFYRPAEVDLLWGNSDAARNELNWNPEISFDKLVERMVKNDIKIYGNNS